MLTDSEFKVFEDACDALEQMTELFSVDTSGVAYSNLRERFLDGNPILRAAGSAVDKTVIGEVKRISGSLSSCYVAVSASTLTHWAELGIDKRFSELMLDRLRPAMAGASRGMQLLFAGAAEVHDSIEGDCPCTSFDDAMKFWGNDRTDQLEFWESVENKIGSVSS